MIDYRKKYRQRKDKRGQASKKSKQSLHNDEK
jgi:hypothetical protein